MFLLLIIVTVLKLTFTISERTEYQHTIYAGSNLTKNCCISINMALRKLQDIGNSTVVYVHPGIYPLDPGKETVLKGFWNIGIFGQGSVTILCSPHAGLSFVKSENITMKSLIIQGCGGKQVYNTTKRNAQSLEFLHFKVAVYIAFCKNVEIKQVIINSSNGMGLAIYNTLGKVVIQESNFTNNTVFHTYGGGGIRIELSAERSDDPLVYKALYLIRHTHFFENTAKEESYGYSNMKESVFGRGGALSIILRGRAENNTFILDSNKMYNNTANHGAGFYVSFHDDTTYNNISISGLLVTHNFCLTVILTGIGTLPYNATNGGGGMIFTTSTKRNAFNMKKSLFTRNQAVMGGGLSFVTAYYSLSYSSLDLAIDKVNFSRNEACFGSALYSFNPEIFYGRISVVDSRFEGNRPMQFKTSRFDTSNICSGAIYSSNIPLSFNGTIEFHNNMGTAVTIHNSKIYILSKAKVSFTNNSGINGGALGLHECSCIILHKSTKVYFHDNCANNLGGAIYSGYCSITTQLFTPFSQCFVNYYEPQTHPNEWEVDIHFINNSILKHYSVPDYNAIFVDSLHLCWRYQTNNRANNHKLKEAIEKTLCWNGWKYRPSNCSSNIISGLALLSTLNLSEPVFPGTQLQMPTAYDGNYQEKKSFPLQVCMSNNTNDTSDCNHLQNIGPILKCRSCYQHYDKCIFQNNSLHIRISNNWPNSIEHIYQIDFKNCEWPFALRVHLYHKYLSCSVCELTVDGFECSSDHYCHIGSYYKKLKPKYCLTSSIIGKCPLAYSSGWKSHFSRQFHLPFDNWESNQSCSDGRTGRLCGGCINGFGVPINSIYLQCVNCTGTEFPIPGWLLFVIVEILPVTAFVILILVLNIKLTNGSFNAYILYAQVLSVSFPGLTYPPYFTEYISENYSYVFDFSPVLMSFPGSVWNLNFMTLVPVDTNDPLVRTDYKHLFPICITSDMTPLGAISFWYLILSYPLVLLLLLYVWIIMYEKGFRCVVYITRPIHRLLARFWRMFDIEPSLTHSTASVYVLCFTQFVATSLKILHPTSWQSLKTENDNGLAFYYDGQLNYFGWPHSLAGLSAIAVLVVIVLLPILFLLFFPFKWFQKCLDCIHFRQQGLVAMADAFNGPFKNGTENSIDCRSFPALYFIVKIMFMVVYVSPWSIGLIISLEFAISILAGGLIMIFHPYNRFIHNLMEFLIFLLLAFEACAYLLNSLLPGKRPHTFSFIILTMMYIPEMAAVCYFLYWLSKKCQSCYKYCRPVRDANRYDLLAEESVSEDHNYDNDSFADRIINPDHYIEHHVGHFPPRYQFQHFSRPRKSVEPLLSLVTPNYGSIGRRHIKTC